jgi:glucokinase
LVEVPLARIVEDRLKMRVVLENDANAAALAEAACGAAAGLAHVVMITLGTGVGGGLFLGGKIYRGTKGGAAELGHMIVERGGLECRCGASGCLEMYASGPALARYASVLAGDEEADPDGALQALEQEDRLTGEAVGTLALRSHPGASEAVKQLAGWLGAGLVSIANVFDPEMIVVGGGVSGLGEVLLGPAREYVRRNAMGPGRETVKIAAAELGNGAGLVGAGLTAWTVTGREGGSDARPRADGG